MKTRRAFLLSITFILALCAACGVWLHRERRQYALNRQLVAALEHDDTKTALALVNAGADPNTRHYPSPAPTLKRLLNQWLHHAHATDNNTPTAFLFACGLDWWEFSNKHLRRHFRCREDIDLLQAMLAHGANIRSQANGKQTALAGAVLLNRTRVAELLLAQGADVNTQDKDGATPLMAVAYNGSREMPRLLLAHGANLNARDHTGSTALHYAVIFQADTAVVGELLAQGADPNLPDKDGETPLLLAQKANLPDLVRLLKQHGAK